MNHVCLGHSHELHFVFGTVPDEATKGEKELSESMLEFWTNFAKTGDPNCAVPNCGTSNWSEYTNEMKTMVFKANDDEDTTVGLYYCCKL